jgi:hypothetical protein
MERLVNGVSSVTQLWNLVTLKTPADRDDIFCESSVLTRGTRYKVPDNFHISQGGSDGNFHTVPLTTDSDIEELCLLGCYAMWLLQ